MVSLLLWNILRTLCLADVSIVSPSSEQTRTKGQRSKRQLNTICHWRQTYYTKLCYQTLRTCDPESFKWSKCIEETVTLDLFLTSLNPIYTTERKRLGKDKFRQGWIQLCKLRLPCRYFSVRVLGQLPNIVLFEKKLSRQFNQPLCIFILTLPI